MNRFSMVILSMTLISSFAFAGRNDVSEILDLAEQVRYAARSSQASDANLEEAKAKLRDVIALLNETGGGYDDECFKFAYQKYYAGQSSAKATDSAIAFCRKIDDVPVATFLYEKLYSGMSSVAAMDKAAELANGSLSRKLAMLEFAFQKYYSGMSSVAAITRSAEQIGTVRVGQLNCLKALYDKYYSSMSSVKAMDAAVQGCQ